MTATDVKFETGTCTEYADEMSDIVEQAHSKGQDVLVLRWETDLSDGFSDFYYEIITVEDRGEFAQWLDQNLPGPNGSTFDMPLFGDLVPNGEVEVEPVLFGEDFVELFATWMPVGE